MRSRTGAARSPSTNAAEHGVGRSRPRSRERPRADLGGLVSGRWLAANPCRRDRETWGWFEILAECSQPAQNQIVEAAAAAPGAAGIDQEIADFWQRHGHARLEAGRRAADQPFLDRIDGSDAPDVAAYLRDGFAAGRSDLFRLRPAVGPKDSSKVIAYATQGRPRAARARLLPRGRKDAESQDPRGLRRARRAAARNAGVATAARSSRRGRARARDAPGEGVGRRSRCATRRTSTTA